MSNLQAINYRKKTFSRRNKIKRTKADLIADFFITLFLAIAAIITVLPFIYVTAGSFATEKELTEKAFFLVPEVWSLNAYKYAIKSANILLGLRNSVIITLVGTILCIVFSLTFAYPLSKKHLRGRNWIMNMVIFTMLFSGGMIPSFLVISAYGLYDSWWALILPALISPFNMIIIKNFFQQIPLELEEASYVDGANDLQIFTKIYLPLSKPVIASVALFYGVGFWNNYFSAMIYLKTPALYTIQIQLRSIILLTSQIDDMVMDYYDMNGAPPGKAVKMACTVIATVPILLVYPFIQKYFTKGVMVGAVKG